jgi:hypothetical protein
MTISGIYIPIPGAYTAVTSLTMVESVHPLLPLHRASPSVDANADAGK